MTDMQRRFLLPSPLRGFAPVHPHAGTGAAIAMDPEHIGALRVLLQRQIATSERLLALLCPPQALPPGALTPRQRQVMEHMLAGHPSKNIAADLGISQRTVENHRAAVMRQTGATSLPALARIALGAPRHSDCR